MSTFTKKVQSNKLVRKRISKEKLETAVLNKLNKHNDYVDVLFGCCYTVNGKRIDLPTMRTKRLTRQDLDDYLADAPELMETVVFVLLVTVFKEIN